MPVSLKSPCSSESNAKVNLPPSAGSVLRNHLYILSSRRGTERIGAGSHEKAKDPPSKKCKSVMKSKSHQVVKWWLVRQTSDHHWLLCSMQFWCEKPIELRICCETLVRLQ